MKFKSLIISLLAVAALSSCSSKKTVLPYFQDISDQSAGVLSTLDFPEPKIMPDDELSIIVNSSNPAVTAEFNSPAVNPNTRTAYGMSTQVKDQTYIVSKEGCIDFPTLGKIKVTGMTTEQLKDILTEKISKDVTDPRVEVRLVNFVVNVGGEVSQPGRFTVDRNRFSVLDAISQAGDLTPYGRRDRVLVIREGLNGREFAHLDLNSSDLLSSPYYYLQQNDYIYVEPNDIKQSISRYNTQNSYKLQVTSTIVSAASVIASLVIALTLK